MDFKPLAIEGAFEIIPRAFTDERGSFATVYEQLEFEKYGLSTNWVADNMSFNYKRGTLRGLHFQKPPSAQTKLVRAQSGRVLDVLVDLRQNSPSYLKWVGIELDSGIMNAAYIPKGCAHGYLTLTDTCIVSYKVDAFYDKSSEGGLLWNDSTLAIKWHFSDNLTISEKDKLWPPLTNWINPF